MIAFVQGPVAAITPGSAVVEVGGVGMLVKCTPRTLAALRIGEPTRLTTALIVKEDSLTLYGFADEDERATFDVLLTASGVAATMALGMLATFTPDELRRIVAQGDAKSLTAVPRIGPKLAQKLLLEYKDKLGAPHGSVPAQKPIAAGPAPGASSCTPPWSVSATLRARPTRRSPPSRPRPRRRAAPTSAPF